MMIGIYALADRRADDAFLAAVLTVIGYSVMDTIVILDRIRENTKLMAGAAVRDDRQRIDQADDDAFVQHARDRRHHARRAARARRREPEELRLRAARRHLLGRLPLDLLLGAARARLPQTSARSGGERRKAGLATERTAIDALAREASRAAEPQRRGARRHRRRSPRAPRESKDARARPRRSLRALSQEARTPAASRGRTARRGDETIDPLDAQTSGLHDEAHTSKATKRSRSTSKASSSEERERTNRRPEQHEQPRRPLPPPTPSEAAFERASHADTVDAALERGVSRLARAPTAVPIATRSSRARSPRASAICATRYAYHRRRVAVPHQARRRFVRGAARRDRRTARRRRARTGARAREPVRRQCDRRALRRPCNSDSSTAASPRISRR